MSLVVTPRTGNSHEVGGEFPDDHLHLLMGMASVAEWLDRRFK